jgi:hypothetical protein
MRPFKSTLSALALTAIALALLPGPATAQFLIGGHNETSENMTAAFAVLAPTPTPGAIGPVLGGPHILISEVVVTPTGSEFIEICNPTPVAVGLGNTYLSDDWFTTTGVGYHKFPQAGYVVTTTTDFTVRFPAGSQILPGQTLVVAVDGAAFLAAFGIAASFEINGTDPGTPDMVDVGGNAPRSTALLTNTIEFVVLFHWDGVADNVCDNDYVCWGGTPGTGAPVDKTGIAVDGPDADAIATPYLADTPVAAQLLAAAPGAGFSIQRLECMELGELVPGNGCIPGATPALTPTWGQVKVRYR